MDVFLNYFQWLPFRPLRKVFDITLEGGLGNAFASLQTLATAFILLLIYLSSSPRKQGWAFLATFFGYLAFDDATSFHERVGTSIKHGVDTEKLQVHFTSYYWQVFFVPIFALAALYILYFVWTELRHTGWLRYIVSGFFLFAVAVFLDFLDGLHLEVWDSYTMRHFQRLIEEFIEMFGTTLCLVAFFAHLTEGRKQIEIT